MNFRNLIIIPVGDLEVNCVIFICPNTGSAAVFDPGDEPDKIISEIERNNAVPKIIINTHCHYDHIGAVENLRNKYKIPFCVHESEEEYASDPEKNYSIISGKPVSIAPDSLLKDGQKIMIGETELTVIHTPGHTLGGCCFMIGGCLLSGDTLFAGSVGRADLYGGDENTLINSIKNKILVLDENMPVIPGHGRTTTLKEEKRFNPFL
ncbi:MAG: MBL fold metallo-hydrolase [Candidatus Delongbacteria bacterium]|jgi:glyoxylase-like metal-dependent hydrolase (beta-lactamase superfamily II)|nr:MBL fold metallo-hydrolase [Candidatus Delongbacteria bacterium]